jgi:hypothetical protein
MCCVYGVIASNFILPMVLFLLCVTMWTSFEWVFCLPSSASWSIMCKFVRHLRVDFYLFWCSITCVEALQGELDFCLAEADPWPFGGFAIYFKL